MPNSPSGASDLIPGMAESKDTMARLNAKGAASHKACKERLRFGINSRRKASAGRNRGKRLGGDH
jgi:hypothetical protein